MRLLTLTSFIGQFVHLVERKTHDVQNYVHLCHQGYKIYVDIMTGENCSQFRLLTWTSFIGRFFNSVRGEGMGKGGGGASSF